MTVQMCIWCQNFLFFNYELTNARISLIRFDTLTYIKAYKMGQVRKVVIKVINGAVYPNEISKELNSCIPSPRTKPHKGWGRICNIDNKLIANMFICPEHFNNKEFPLDLSSKYIFYLLTV